MILWWAPYWLPLWNSWRASSVTGSSTMWCRQLHRMITKPGRLHFPSSLTPVWIIFSEAITVNENTDHFFLHKSYLTLIQMSNCNLVQGLKRHWACLIACILHSLCLSIEVFLPYINSAYNVKKPIYSIQEPEDNMRLNFFRFVNEAVLFSLWCRCLVHGSCSQTLGSFAST